MVVAAEVVHFFAVDKILMNTAQHAHRIVSGASRNDGS